MALRDDWDKWDKWLLSSGIACCVTQTIYFYCRHAMIITNQEKSVC